MHNFPASATRHGIRDISSWGGPSTDRAPRSRTTGRQAYGHPNASARRSGRNLSAGELRSPLSRYGFAFAPDSTPLGGLRPPDRLRDPAPPADADQEIVPGGPERPLVAPRRGLQAPFRQESRGRAPDSCQAFQGLPDRLAFPRGLYPSPRCPPAIAFPPTWASSSMPRLPRRFDIA